MDSKSRNYILDRIRSKLTTTEEFNFDKLSAPPLYMFFSPADIYELYSIAKSIKYAAKPKERYKAIDNVCKRRGLVKFAAGTNRVVYKHPEFPNILFKIAADDVGLGDNPAEYKNQFILKPFVAKTFEVSPCGTVAIVEKCNPITSREEFISIADDIFEMLSEWLVGKYVLADIGAKFFMNWSTRVGFGPVLIDYPYCYEVDGDKLYCNKPDMNSITGTCDGEIDYDAGFNFLMCTKCGRIYKARELEKKMKDNELILERRKGEINMKIVVRGGSKNIDKTVETGSYNKNFTEEGVEALPRNNFVKTNRNNKTVTINLKELTAGITKEENIIREEETGEELVEDIKEEIPVVEVVESDDESTSIINENSITNKHHNTMAVNGVLVNNSNENHTTASNINKVVYNDKVVDTIKLDPEDIVPAKANKEEKIVNSPFEISEDIKKEAQEKAKNTKMGSVEIIDNAIDTIIENLNNITIDKVKDEILEKLSKKLSKYITIPEEEKEFKGSVEELESIMNELDDLFNATDKKENFISAVIKYILSNYKDINYKNLVLDDTIRGYDTYEEGIDNTLRIIMEIMDELDDESYVDTASSKEFISLFNNIFSINPVITNAEREGKNLLITIDSNLYYAWDENKETISDINNDTTIEITDVFDDEESNNNENVIEEYTSDNTEKVVIVPSKMINIKNVLPKEFSRDVLVLLNEDGSYYTNKNGNTIVVDKINDQDTDNIKLVSKNWFNNVNAIIDTMEEDTGDSNNEDNTKEEVDEENLSEEE